MGWLNAHECKMTINSRNKGANGEREFANALADKFGIKPERNLSQSRGGGHDLLMSGELGKFAVEVKRSKTVTDAKLIAWWKQAVDQAEKARLIPMLAYRADRQSWRVMIPLNELVDNYSNETAIITIDGLRVIY